MAQPGKAQLRHSYAVSQRYIKPNPFGLQRLDLILAWNGRAICRAGRRWISPKTWGKSSRGMIDPSFNQHVGDRMPAGVG